MFTAVSMFVLLSFSVLLIRTASVALRLTGLSDQTARFQALSAFSGTGFTTTEAEMIVNYPLRRRIISLLMVIGNIGLVSVLTTLVVSMMNSPQTEDGISLQLYWLLGSLLLLWILMLNPIADRVLCGLISAVLQRYTRLGQRHYQKLVQLDGGFSVCEHLLMPDSGNSLTRVKYSLIDVHQMTILQCRLEDGQHVMPDTLKSEDNRVQSLILFGPDSAHEAVAESHDKMG